jgi:hypothetical protein
MASVKYNKGQLEAFWIKAGGPRAQAKVAAAIALAESGGNPSAKNPEGPEHAEGLWQIKGQLVAGNPFNPEVSAANAVAKYNASKGFSPWTTFTSGAYKSYLGSSSKQAELIPGEDSIPIIGAIGESAQSFGEKVGGLPEAGVNAIGEALGITGPVSSVEGFLKALVAPSTWLRLAEGVGGIVLFMVGLKTLTRGSVSLPSLPKVGVAAAVGGEVGAKRASTHARQRSEIRTSEHAAATQNRIRLAQKTEAAKRATARAEAKAAAPKPRPAPRTQTSTR